MAAEDAGEEFTEMLSTIGQNVLALVRTIREENKRREAQKAAMEKDRRSEEMAEQRRMEDREFLKSENEKMRSELRDILKANGMETSDKNVDLAQGVAEKMKDNQSQIDSNLSQIDANQSQIDANLSKIDANNKAIGRLDDQIKGIGTGPKDQGSIDQFTKMRTELTSMNSELMQQNTDLAKKNTDLGQKNRELEASNIMLKNGKGLEGLETDQSVRQNLAKQLDQVNAGIALDNKNLNRVNGRLSEIEDAQKKALNPSDGSLPKMDAWEKLQAEKLDLQKEKEGLQKGLAQKQDQLKGLKEGKSLEQLEKAAKLEGQIRQAQEKVQGIDNVLQGYKKNEAAILDKHKEILKTPGKNLEQSDYDELSKIRAKMKPFEDEKAAAQKDVVKLQEELDGVKNGPKVEGAKVDAPKTEGPKMEGTGKMVQGPGGGITSPGVPMELESAPKQVLTSPSISQTPDLTLDGVGVGGSSVGKEAPKVGEGRQRAKSVGDKPDNGKPLSVREELARRGETTGYELEKMGLKQGQPKQQVMRMKGG
ncbi:hypothetical protein DES53_101955 [Roseimicrobium gellanilyticum]|uniref:Uncharacterized protein n=1 Tax=Roseimicrobium gellanilyticum TaxID=748857 RepID=A0A366HXE3_9BACT|nr:hypothetical protein [Roseimicrobium gellanilyticum]RBP48155.1 hypothetical protein DES53_101955 [Roseimicrobium gellanilyticum]